MNSEPPPPEKPLPDKREPIFNPKAFEAAPVIALVVAMIVIQAWIHFGGLSAANEIYGRFSFISERFWDGEALHTLLTYAMLHGDWGHLAMNAVALFALGGACWRIMGTGRFFLFFALTAIAGSLLFAAIRPNETGPLVGASGSIFGLIAAIKRLEFRILGLRGEDTMPGILRFMGLIVLINAILGWATAGLMAWEAHIGGFALGWLITPWLVKFWPR